MITVQNISKQFLIPHEKRDKLRDHFLKLFQRLEYENFHALDDISFSVKKGEWIGVIGKNGSGKSTLLRILSGILPAHNGTYKVNGKVTPLLGLGIGFDDELTVNQNIFLNGVLLGLSHQVLKTKRLTILQFADIESFQDTKLKNLSSGMRLRLAFALVREIDGDILLLDEIIAVGDQNFQQKCDTVLSDWKKQGKTVLLVSHNLEKIRQLADRVIWLEHGKIRLSGLPSDVISQYEKHC